MTEPLGTLFGYPIVMVDGPTEPVTLYFRPLKDVCVRGVASARYIESVVESDTILIGTVKFTITKIYRAFDLVVRWDVVTEHGSEAHIDFDRSPEGCIPVDGEVGETSS